jgi:hypothetical protein
MKWRTGGEPDVVGQDQRQAFIFMIVQRKVLQVAETFVTTMKHWKQEANKPGDSAMNMATAMGIEILTVEEYRDLQKLGHFDAKTSSWVKTPPDVRKLGGALFTDYRFGTIFVYHNGADSYYSARGFRGSLRV